MKRLLRLSCCLLLSIVALCGGVNAGQGECTFSLANIVTTALKVSESFGNAYNYKVNATSDVTYTHKNGSSLTETINLGEQVIAVSGDNQQAKKRAEALLRAKAREKLEASCNNRGCNRQ